LIELANSPDAVADFHVEVTNNNGPVSANHCARVIRATYKRAARRDISLPARLPTSAVEFNDETPSQKALDFKKFPAWLKAWRKIDNATSQAYHLTELLTGTRPGELARIRWADVKHNERNLVIGKAKGGQDIVVPVTEEIAAALQMARDDAERLGLALAPDELVFPGCAQISAREALPARGNMLRHTYRTVAADLGVDDLLIHFLMGHAPEGISQKYVATLILANGPAMRAAQERISARMLKEFGLTPKTLREEVAAGLATSLEAGRRRALESARTLAPSLVKGKGAYQWINDLPIAELPQWVIDKAGTPADQGPVPEAEFEPAYTQEQFEERLKLIEVDQFSGKHDEWLAFMFACTHSSTVDDGKAAFIDWTTRNGEGEYASAADQPIRNPKSVFN
jgi:hypothetical protein